MSLSWIIAGGGTGGHVFPSLALAEIIAERGDSVLFIGSEQGLEGRLVPAAGFDLLALPSAQIMGQNLLGRMAGLLRILQGVGRAAGALRSRRADIVISLGGYAAMPGVLAAILLRYPLVLIEPNAIPGRANALTARFARMLFTGFRTTAASPRLEQSRATRHLGIPLRSELVSAFREAPARKPATSPLRIFVFGGSQGARQINEAMMEMAPELRDQPLELFHQTGEADRERVAAAYAKAGLQAEVVGFESRMPLRYRWADLAICRAGAMTVAELAMAGLPALLIPYPYAADDHQAANADVWAEAGAGHRIESRPLDGKCLRDSLLEFCEAPERLAPMAAAASALARPDAAREIVEASALLARGVGI